MFLSPYILLDRLLVRQDSAVIAGSRDQHFLAVVDTDRDRPNGADRSVRVPDDRTVVQVDVPRLDQAWDGWRDLLVQLPQATLALIAGADGHGHGVVELLDNAVTV